MAKNFQDHAQNGDMVKHIVPLNNTIMDFLEITKAQYVGDHKIHLWFNNNVDRVVDFSDKLKGAAFEPLRDLAFFKNFHIAYNTIEWANGADFAPEYLLNC